MDNLWIKKEKKKEKERKRKKVYKERKREKKEKRKEIIVIITKQILANVCFSAFWYKRASHLLQQVNLNGQ